MIGGKDTALSSLWLLRLGLLCQVGALAVSYIVYFFSCPKDEKRLFSFYFTGFDEAVMEGIRCRSGVTGAAFLHLIGAGCLSCFQVMLADDASLTRGFRAGSKVISYATLYDICASALQFVLFFHFMANYSPQIWAQYTNGGSEWLLTTFTRLLHAIAMMLYGQGFFLVEAFHDVGTSTFLGLAVALSYIASGVLEILGLGLIPPEVGTFVCLVAMIFALAWALAFEHTLNASSPPLHQCELTNEIESRINHYARVAHEAYEDA